MQDLVSRRCRSFPGGRRCVFAESSQRKGHRRSSAWVYGKLLSRDGRERCAAACDARRCLSRNGPPKRQSNHVDADRESQTHISKLERRRHLGIFAFHLHHRRWNSNRRKDRIFRGDPQRLRGRRRQKEPLRRLFQFIPCVRCVSLSNPEIADQENLKGTPEAFLHSLYDQAEASWQRGTSRWNGAGSYAFSTSRKRAALPLNPRR